MRDINSDNIHKLEEMIAAADLRMQRIREKIDERENPPSPFQRDKD